jgi:hypothetical protein
MHEPHIKWEAKGEAHVSDLPTFVTVLHAHNGCCRGSEGTRRRRLTPVQHVHVHVHVHVRVYVLRLARPHPDREE